MTAALRALRSLLLRSCLTALRSLGQWFGPAARANPNMGSSGCRCRMRRLRRTDVRLQVKTVTRFGNKFPAGHRFPLPSRASLALRRLHRHPNTSLCKREVLALCYLHRYLIDSLLHHLCSGLPVRLGPTTGPKRTVPSGPIVRPIGPKRRAGKKQHPEVRALHRPRGVRLSCGRITPAGSCRRRALRRSRRWCV